MTPIAPRAASASFGKAKTSQNGPPAGVLVVVDSGGQLERLVEPDDAAVDIDHAEVRRRRVDDETREVALPFERAELRKQLGVQPLVLEREPRGRDDSVEQLRPLEQCRIVGEDPDASVLPFDGSRCRVRVGSNGRPSMSTYPGRSGSQYPSSSSGSPSTSRMASRNRPGAGVGPSSVINLATAALPNLPWMRPKVNANGTVRNTAID